MGAFEFLRRGLPFRAPRNRVPEVADPIERLRRQHQELQIHLARARAGLPPHARGSERRARVRTISELEALLIEHFHLEEVGGYLADALRVAPRYNTRAGEQAKCREDRHVHEAWDAQARKSVPIGPPWAWR